MTKRLLVTVDGKQYDVLVEVLDGTPSAAPAPIPAAPAPAPQAPPPPPPAPVTPVPAPAAAPAAAPASAPGDVPSPLSGRVVEIPVKLGQVVKEGDHVLTLEAMKMNTSVFANRSGTVTAIKTAVGEAVQEGAGLMTIG